MPTCRRLLTAAALAGLAGAAPAAPVEAGELIADPYDLAVRWTLAALSPRELAPPPAAAPAPVVRLSAVPLDGATSGVPDPGAYALMGLLLLGAGLLAKRLTAGRGRGAGRAGAA